MRRITRREKEIFWDYNLEKIDLEKPEVKKWYLKRKLDFGDLSGLRRIDLEKYLSGLDIDISLKKLLVNYLKPNAKV